MVTQPQPQLYNPCGGHLCLDFANSIGRWPGGTGNERLCDYQDLLLWSVQAGSLPAAAARSLGRLAGQQPGEAAAVLDRARTLREAVFGVFSAALHGRAAPPADLALLNAELGSALARARIEPAAVGFAWAWPWSAGAIDAPLWPVADAAAALLVSPDRERVKECDSETCSWLFVDRTRNRGRRWCEMKGCGNRAKVREHRRRRRG